MSSRAVKLTGERVVFLAAILTALLPVKAAVGQEASHDGPYLGDEPWPAAAAAPEAAPLWSQRIVGSAFKPRQNDVSYTVDSNGGCVYVTAGDSTSVWNTPVHLPQGATVDTLRVYYYDTSASNLTVWFTVYDLYGSIVDEWSASSSTAAGNSFNDSAQIGHVVDYGVYSYVVNWRPNATGSTLRLCGVRIFYQPPSEIFLDGFESGSTNRWSSVTP